MYVNNVPRWMKGQSRYQLHSAVKYKTFCFDQNLNIFKSCSASGQVSVPPDEQKSKISKNFNHWKLQKQLKQRRLCKAPFAPNDTNKIVFPTLVCNMKLLSPPVLKRCTVTVERQYIKLVSTLDRHKEAPRSLHIEFGKWRSCANTDGILEQVAWSQDEVENGNDGIIMLLD